MSRNIGPSEKRLRAVEEVGSETASAPAVEDPKYTIPEHRRGILQRQRLLDLLYETIDHPLHLICAPAGYGKTTLLADFAHDADLTVCWYTADELDSDPRSFLLHVVKAIASRFPTFEDDDVVSTSHSPESSPGPATMARNLVDAIRERIPEYFVLVVDDFHIVSNSSGVMEAVDFLAAHLPDNCRLMVLSREIPQITSLARLISQRKVSGLGITELRFTWEEIRQLFQRNFDLDISAEEAHRLERESEGWITSIMLTSHSLWKGLFREFLENQGNNSLLFDYIAAEVFSQQPAEVRQFLLATSVCNEFDEKLGNALIDGQNSARLIEDVEAKNLFITQLGGEHRWYRYHHLFRDFLREKLRQDDPSLFLELNIRAAGHYLSSDQPRQAIHHYIQGSEFRRAMELLESEAEPLSEAGLWEMLGSWLDRIPSQDLATRPQLILYLSRVYQLRGRSDDAIKLLNDAIEVSRESGDHSLEAQALMRRSVSLRFKGAYQMAIRDARAALGLARDRGTAEDLADARNNLGVAYAHQGKFSQAAREFRGALKGYQQLGSLFQLSVVHTRLGSVYSDLGEPSKAVTNYGLARQGY